MAHVVILGGGFGGLAGANRLRELLDDGDDITVVDVDESFYMGFAKLWDLAGMRPLEEGTASLYALEERGVTFRRSEIRGIDPESRVVDTETGELEADALLVALGAGPSPAHRDLLYGDGLHDLYDDDSLPAMKTDLDTIEEGRVVIAVLGKPYKCPPAPYEAALIVDERLRHRGVRDAVDVVVTTPLPMAIPPAGPDASRYVAEHLEGQDVSLLAGHTVDSIGSDRNVVSFEDGSELDYSLLLGVPANVPPPVIADTQLAGPSGWIEPDPRTLQTAFGRVYAVGDCTHVPTAGGALPMAGVFAQEQAEVAARNIAADLAGTDERASYDGHGYCFLELPGERVAFVEGNFYADPPDVSISPADHEQFERKQRFERDHLAAWLG